MRSYLRLIWGNCVVGGLAMAMSGGLVGAADCTTAIDRAIAEWNEKEPTWVYRQTEREPAPGRVRFPSLDQRTRIALGRPIAQTLARACGESGVKALQERVEESPELILLALDELGATDVVAKYLVTCIQNHKPCAPNVEACKMASMCSSATRRATALALAKMPPIGGDDFADHVARFVVAAGNSDTLRALETAANDPTRADWRPYYLIAASIIRSREAMPPEVRDIRAKDDLLFWQANADMLNYHAVSMNYEQSAQTLLNQHERISTGYLLEKLGECVEEASLANHDRENHVRHIRHPNVGPVGLTLCILGKQGDPAAIPGLEAFSRRNPRLVADVRTTIEAIQGTTEAKPADGSEHHPPAIKQRR